MNLGTVWIRTWDNIVRLDSVTKNGTQVTAHLNKTLAQRVREAKEALWVEQATCPSR